jgi:plastocyanin
MPMSSRIVRSMVAMVGGLALASCGSDDSPLPTTQNPPPANTVQATTSNTFNPSTLTVSVGTTVTFAFASVAHNVFFDNAPAGAPANITAPTANQSVTRVFSTAGSFPYNCHLHNGMSGRIVVQ